VGRNVAYLAIGGLVLYAGLLALIAAACIGAAVLLGNVMDSEIASWLGPLIVGAIVAIVGYVFVQKAISTFKHESLMPRKTMESLRENTEWVKDQIKTTENRMTQPDRMPETTIR
jgi:xanthine/uracil permease